MKLWQKLEYLSTLSTISFVDGGDVETPYNLKAKRLLDKHFDKVMKKKKKQLKKFLEKNIKIMIHIQVVLLGVFICLMSMMKAKKLLLT